MERVHTVTPPPPEPHLGIALITWRGLDAALLTAQRTGATASIANGPGQAFADDRFVPQ